MSLTLLDMLKQAEQDYEWYPTTRKMLQVVSETINTHRPHNRYNYRCSNDLTGFLDIGAGDGRALAYFKEHVECVEEKFMAIEKSEILAKRWPEYIFPVGSDFLLQNLFDKQVRTIFCNPPYKQFKNWMLKVVNEGYFVDCYFIVPDRWKNDDDIQAALKSRHLKAESIWTGDFLDAERSARAKVEIVALTHEASNSAVNDPFDDWFDNHFKFNEAQTDSLEDDEDSLHEKALVNGKNLIEGLVELYQNELFRLHESYAAITSLEIQNLKDIGVNKKSVRAALKEKISNLKIKYWSEVFNNLDKITDRLSSKSRKVMLEKLTSKTNIDFDVSNVYSVLIWVIKNANAYFDKQLVEIFENLACKKSAIPYKSNKHFAEGTWRSMSSYDIRRNGGKYLLDYRFIKSGSFFESGPYGDYERVERRNELLGDIATIAFNLGFNICECSSIQQNGWAAGEKREMYFKNSEAEKEILVAAKVYKNGNIHLWFNQEFMQKLNIEAGRLLGWITSAQEAEEETGIKVSQDIWNTSFKLDINNVIALAA